MATLCKAHPIVDPGTEKIGEQRLVDFINGGPPDTSRRLLTTPKDAVKDSLFLVKLQQVSIKLLMCILRGSMKKAGCQLQTSASAAAGGQIFFLFLKTLGSRLERHIKLA